MTAKPFTRKAVLFDAVGTLFSLRASVGEIYFERARRFGFRPSSATAARDLTASFGGAFKRQGPLAFPYRGERLLEAERAWWREVVAQTFAPVGEVPRMEELFEDLYNFFRTSAPWRLEEDAVEVLTEIRRRGCGIAVVTNYDSRIHEVLAGLGIRRLIDEVVVSSASGAAKPDRRIFLTACSLLQTPPTRSTHVGDNYDEDYVGARAAGLSAVLFDPEGRRPELKPMRVSKLAELPDILL